jgi:hypothetical protein
MHPKETTYRMSGATTNKHTVAAYSSSRDFLKGLGHETEFKFFIINIGDFLKITV